ncbi:tRNA(Ile)-lysidine synthetase, partial [candidate division WOR-3 bacterium]|nr:tRNA(Ile)-lysidine synthetase [candidate division WOR-3 bacterium]
MVEKVLKTVEKYKLLENGDKVLVAVSGGPDSMFLLQALQDIKAQYKLELRIAHLNHQLRESAWEEADFVKEQAERFGIPCTIEEKDVRS